MGIFYYYHMVISREYVVLSALHLEIFFRDVSNKAFFAAVSDNDTPLGETHVLKAGKSCELCRSP